MRSNICSLTIFHVVGILSTAFPPVQLDHLSHYTTAETSKPLTSKSPIDSATLHERDDQGRVPIQRDSDPLTNTIGGYANSNSTGPFVGDVLQADFTGSNRTCLPFDITSDNVGVTWGLETCYLLVYGADDCDGGLHSGLVSIPEPIEKDVSFLENHLFQCLTGPISWKSITWVPCSSGID